MAPTPGTAATSMEDLLEQVGSWGRLQWLLVASIKWGVMPVAWNMLHMTFGGMVPDWWCLPPTPDHHGNASSWTNGHVGNWSRDNVTFEKCDIPGSDGHSCVGCAVFDDSVSTVVSQWALICDRSYIKGLMTSLQMGGVLLGAVLGGQSSDTFGRRLTVYVTMLAHTIASLVAAFSVTWQMFVVMRVLIGVTLGLYLVSSFSYSFEFVSPKHRQLVAFIPSWAIGVCLFALIAWLFPNWRYLHIGAAILGVPFLLTWFVIPESARWLATKGRLEEAERVVRYVARVNRRPQPDNCRLALQHVAQEEEKAGQGRRYTYLDVYRGWRMAVPTLVLNFIWFAMSFSYYGISFGVSALSGNLYFNIFLMSIVELPSNLASVYLANRLGRRWTCMLFYGLCAFFGFAILVVNKTVAEDKRGMATVVLALGSKLSVSSAWLSVSVITSEHYPTVIRNLGYGASNTVARVGGILAPLLLNMDTDKEVVRAYVIIGSLMVACSLGSLLLRETKGQVLQDSITPGNKVENNNGVKDAIESVKDANNKVKDNAEGEGQDHATGRAKATVWTVES